MSSPSLGTHDVGGNVDALPSGGGLTITQEEQKPRQLETWEKKVDALVGLLMLGADKPFNVHMLRRQIESLPPQVYKTAPYYERWLLATIALCRDKGLFTHQDFEAAFHMILPPEHGDTTATSSSSNSGSDETVLFHVGDHVRVRMASDGQGEESLTPSSLQHATIHKRAPGYIHGKLGLVEVCCAAYENPSLLSLGLQGPKQPLYRVRFHQKDVWGDRYTGPATDTIDVELYHNWLEKVDKKAEEHHDRKKTKTKHHHEHQEGAEAHHHDHDHPHPHQRRQEIEAAAKAKETPLTTNDVLCEALIDVLVKKGVLTVAAVQQQVDKMDSAAHQMLGAVLIAEAWKDPEFREVLVRDPREACKKLGIDPGNYITLHVVANTPQVHNVVVCTLCSCYPRALLGLPPDWYKSFKYRSRVVVEPRAVLKEFGLDLPDDVKVQVHDSTADLRYLVLPMPPEGCDPQEDRWTRDVLKAMVTRDCCIGVGVPKLPQA